MKLILKIFLIVATSAILITYTKPDTFTREPLLEEEENIATTTHEAVSVEEEIKVENKKPIEKPALPKQTVPEKILSITPPLTDKIDFEAINTRTREALINVFCVTKGSNLQPITGSGVLVDPKGIILTNAHIGQYFLLDNFVDCYIRTGNPATARYRAKLIYISQKWIQENAENIVTENPKGTGENDYAFLAIEGTVDNSPLPTTFPYLEMEINKDVQKNDQVLIAGYPAGFLGGISVQNNLSILSSLGTVANIFTFNESTIDLLSIQGSLLAQKGSSGGAVVNKESKIVGIVVTATQESQTGERELRAVTTNHIDRSLFSEISQNTSLFFSGNTTEKMVNFEIAYKKALSEILINEIEEKE